jgi:hypothetical protein
VWLAASLAARRAVSPVASEAWWERRNIITMARTIMIIIITIITVTTIIINRGGQLKCELQRKRVKLTDDGSKIVEWGAGFVGQVQERCVLSNEPAEKIRRAWRDPSQERG